MTDIESKAVKDRMALLRDELRKAHKRIAELEAPPPVDVPTEPGWYWMREQNDDGGYWDAIIVKVNRFPNGELVVFEVGARHACPVTDYPAKWRGPIQPPGGE